MKNQTTLIVGGLVVLLALVSGVSAYRSYRAMSQQVHEDRRVLQSLQTDVNRINTQLAEFKSKLARMPERPVSLVDLSPPLVDWSDPSPRRALPPATTENKDGLVSGKVQEDGVPPAPPALAQAIGSERVASYRKELIDRNALLHQEDRAIYGDKVAELYQAARANPASGSSASQDNNAAFNRLVTEYPQANATGMLLSEKALQAARQANTVVAEQYYSSLAANENFSSVVTESGVEAVPALQAYLAYQYIQQNRIAEANALLQSLETKNSSGLLATPGPQGGVEWRPVSETVKKLRTQIGSPSAGQQ